MTSHLSDDVIGSICSGYVPFHTVELIATAIFAFVEVEWLIDLSDILKRPSDINARRHLKRNPLRRVSNRGPVTKIFTKRTFFH